jgi:hypothetical protein
MGAAPPAGSLRDGRRRTIANSRAAVLRTTAKVYRAGAYPASPGSMPCSRKVARSLSTSVFSRSSSLATVLRPAAAHRVRFRWERLALAQRHGEAIPPIEVYRVCDRHFVIDGHHRVSIAATTGERQIEAYVTQVLAAVPCGPGRALAHQGRRGEAAREAV